MQPKPNHGAPRSADHTAAAALLEAAPAEHIYLADDSGAEDSDGAAKPRTVTLHLELEDRLRGHSAAITLYEEGFLDAEQRGRGQRSRSRRLDMRYLDPVPSVTRHYATRLLRAAAASAAAAAIAAGLSQVDVLQAVGAPVAAAAGAVAAAALLACLYVSREEAVFRTLHGRAAALTLTAGLGRISRLRAIVGHLVRAIGDAEDDIGDDTSVFLRAEMREHYRLRTQGALTQTQCSESTRRILAHFDDEM